MPGQITIPQPCPATWHDMTPAPGGRHCGACNKVVVDFTQLSEVEVLRALGRPGAVCGRFRPKQLAAPRSLATARGNWAGWLTAAAVVLSGCETPAPAGISIRPAPVAADASGFVARGRVVDKHSGQPLPGAYITSLADSTLHTRTDAQGQFELKLPPHLRDSLLFVAYDDQEHDYICRRELPATTMLVRLRESTGVLGQIKHGTGEYAPSPKIVRVEFVPPVIPPEDEPE